MVDFTISNAEKGDTFYEGDVTFMDGEDERTKHMRFQKRRFSKEDGSPDKAAIKDAIGRRIDNILNPAVVSKTALPELEGDYTV